MSNDGPKVTENDVLQEIGASFFFTAGDGVAGATQNSEPIACPESLNLLTFCVLVLKNGYTVVGKAACVSPENFDAEKGKKLAYIDAVNKVWPLLGFRLADKISK